MHRVTLPLFSLLDHRVMDLHLSKNLHGLHIEDLPFNYFAVSANLTTNSLYVHRRGVAWEAVRASSAIPGVLPPFITETGDVLVDGGIVDNLPVAAMHDLKSGPNVVVSLRRRTPWRIDARYAETPNRRTIVRDLLLRRSRQYPSMATVLIHGLTMASEQRRGLPHDAQDLFVTPPGTEQVGLLDWHKGRELLDGAYRDMADKIEKAGGFDALVRAGA
jgi:NTE family protein